MLEQFTKKRTIRLGVVPVRRAAVGTKSFNLQSALETKRSIEAKLEELRRYDVEYEDLSFLNEEGLLYDPLDAEKVAAHFIQREVDALFIPHVNFGSEEAIARLARKMNVPVLLWGPKDYINPDDLYRYRDSQCGLFASSKVLARYGVTFSYIPSCDVDDPSFECGFVRFLAVASVVRAFRNMRIGQISTRPGVFLSVKCNEAELLERFGIDVVPITLPDLKRMVDEATADGEAMEQMRDTVRQSVTLHEVSEADLDAICSFKLAVERWAVQQRLSAIATQCWAPMLETIGIMPCFVLGDVSDDGLPFVCEADIHGAVSAVMALAASRYSTPMFTADVTIRHPDNPNAELLWHCGVFAKSLAKEGAERVVTNQCNRGCPAAGEWELRGGDLSIVRFDGLAGEYSLFCGQCVGTDGPKTRGSYLWVETDDWEKWENKLIFGPYIHHVAGIHGRYSEILKEACRYIPGLAFDPV